MANTWMPASSWKDVAAFMNHVRIQNVARALLQLFVAWIALDILCFAKTVLYRLTTSIPCIVLRYEIILMVYNEIIPTCSIVGMEKSFLPIDFSTRSGSSYSTGTQTRPVLPVPSERT